jgi:hypothetical protein
MPDMPDLNLWSLQEPQCSSTNLKKLIAETDSSADSVLFQFPPSKQPDLPPGVSILPTFSVHEFLEKLNLGILRLVFFSLDLLLMFYRFTNLYLAVRSLCLGFEEHVHLNVEDMKHHDRRIPGPGGHVHKHYSEQYIPLRETNTGDSLHRGGTVCHSSVTDDMTQISDQESVNQAGLVNHGNGNHQAKYKTNGNIVHLPPIQGDSAKQNMLNEDKVAANHKMFALSNGIHTIRTCVRVLVEGTILPKFVLGTAILLLFSVIISTAHNFLTVDNMLSLAGFVPDFVGLRWQIDDVNFYLKTMARQISTAASSWYHGHMMSDMQHLSGMQSFFNEGMYC